jgi:hypothetical protein
MSPRYRANVIEHHLAGALTLWIDEIAYLDPRALTDEQRSADDEIARSAFHRLEGSSRSTPATGASTVR